MVPLFFFNTTTAESRSVYAAPGGQVAHCTQPYFRSVLTVKINHMLFGPSVTGSSFSHAFFLFFFNLGDV